MRLKSGGMVKQEDRLFSHIIIRRDGNTCKYCGCSGEVYHLENSHFWGRRYEGARFDLDDCDALCEKCHRFLEKQKGVGKAYWVWKLEQLGQVRFDALRLKAHEWHKKDRKAVREVLRAIVADMDRREPEIIGGRA